MIHKQAATLNNANTITGTVTRVILTPLARNAINSFSADIFPKTNSTAVKNPHGIVKVSENGRM